MIQRSFSQRVWHTYLHAKYVLNGGKRKFWEYISGG